MRYEIRSLVTCKYLRSPAVLQVFCNFSSFSLNLGGSYVYESVIIVHKSLSLVDTVARKSQLSKYFLFSFLLGDKRYGRTVLLIFIQAAVLLKCGGSLCVS
jgi:hypothetical protein